MMLRAPGVSPPMKLPGAVDADAVRAVAAHGAPGDVGADAVALDDCGRAARRMPFVALPEMTLPALVGGPGPADDVAEAADDGDAVD